MPRTSDRSVGPARSPARVVGIIIAWLTLGAAANVLVAWGAVCVPIGPRAGTRENIAFSPWPIPVPDSWPITADGMRFRYPGVEDLVLTGRLPIPLPSGRNEVLLHETRAGGPFRSLACWSGTRDDSDRPHHPWGDIGMWVVNLPGVGAKILPIAPLWPGFIANTLIYASAGFAGMWMVRKVRRQERLKRNECPACGYSKEGLGKNASCPECGAFVFTEEDQIKPNEPGQRTNQRTTCR